MNPFALINSIKSGGNPQQIMMNMLQKQAGNNPLAQNVLTMAQNGDMQGIETMARNMCRERGIDVEQALAQTKQQFGIK